MAQELVAEADAMDGLVKKKRRAPKRWLAAGPVTPSTPLLVAAEQFPELAKVRAAPARVRPATLPPSTRTLSYLPPATRT